MRCVIFGFFSSFKRAGRPAAREKETYVVHSLERRRRWVPSTYIDPFGSEKYRPHAADAKYLIMYVYIYMVRARLSSCMPRLNNDQLHAYIYACTID